MGDPLAEIALADGNGSRGSATNGSAAPQAAAESAAAQSEPRRRRPTAAQSAAAVIDIITPAGSESVTEGTILEWAVKVGDAVSDGDTVVEISTDKVDMELPAPADGVITEILYEDGDTVGVGEVIARMAVGASAAPAAAPAVAPPSETAARAAPAAAAESAKAATPSHSVSPPASA